MNIKRFLVTSSIGLALMLTVAVDSNTFAQGRGNGGGRPAGAGQPSGGGSVNRGLGTAATRSNGRSDDGLGTASRRSNGRSDAGIDRAKAGRNNTSSMSDTELNRYRGLSRKLGTTPEQMRAAYQSALLANPELKYGQFVAANVIADNLNGRYPGITSSAILGGLANGDSIGETLRDLGMRKEDAKAAEKAAERRIKEAKNRN
ncbi:MAG: hypothetical protein WKF92_09410 [Pyrinomonadaceae bacterium]